MIICTELGQGGHELLTLLAAHASKPMDCSTGVEPADQSCLGKINPVSAKMGPKKGNRFRVRAGWEAHCGNQHAVPPPENKASQRQDPPGNGKNSKRSAVMRAYTAGERSGSGSGASGSGNGAGGGEAECDWRSASRKIIADCLRQPPPSKRTQSRTAKTEAALRLIDEGKMSRGVRFLHSISTGIGIVDLGTPAGN